MISIIIPVYNSERYITRCVESILRQSMTDYEIVLVDDGSTDESGNICKNYESSHHQVRYIRKNNAGVSSARNLGLSVAEGEYVVFIDSDDFVDEDYLQSLWTSISKGYDLVISAANFILPDTIYRPSAEQEQSIYRNSFCRILETVDLTKRTSPWAKIFRKKIIDQNYLTFDEKMPLGEDAVFLFNYVLYCESILVTTDAHYNYVINTPESLTKKTYSYEKELYLYQQIDKAINSLVSSFSISDKNSQKKLLQLRCNYVRRVLDSLYFNERKTSKERISIIKSLPHQCLYKMPMHGSIRARILALLLRIHFVRTYDKIRYLAFSRRLRTA